MTLGRIAPLASVVWIGLTVAALGQMPMPDGQGSGQTMMLAPPQQQGMPPCMAQFVPLRDSAEKKAHVLQDAIKRQVGPQELCAMFNTFTDAEAKVVKFIEANARTCGIPEQAIAATKSNHAKTMEKRQQICAAASFGERRGPGLGEALGMRAVPTPETTSKGGAFDTMSGSPLAR